MATSTAPSLGNYKPSNPFATPQPQSKPDTSSDNKQSTFTRDPFTGKITPSPFNTPTSGNNNSSSSGGGRTSGGSGGGGSSTSSTQPTDNLGQPISVMPSTPTSPQGNTTALQVKNEKKSSGSSVETYNKYDKYNNVKNPKSWVSQIVPAIKGSVRGFFNMQNAGDTTVGGDLFKFNTDMSNLNYVKPSQKETISSNENKITYGQRYEFEKLSQGQGNEPVEYGLQNIQKEVSTEISNSLMPKYQKKIDTGELTYDQATRLYTADFQEQAKKEYGTKADIYIQKRGNLNAFNPVSEVNYGGIATTGALIGASIVAPEVTLPVIAVMGAKSANTGFGKAFLNEDIGWKERGGAFAEGVGGTLFFAGGVSGTTSKLAQDVTKARYKAGEESNSLTIGKEIYKKGDETYFKVTRLKQAPGFKQVSKVEFPVFAKDNGEFIIGQGTGRTKTQVLDFAKQGTGVKDEYMKSIQDFYTRGQGQSGNLIVTTNNGGLSLTKDFPETFKGFKGTGDILIKGKSNYNNFDFAGQSQENEQLVKGFSGVIKKQRIYPNEITGMDVNLKTTGGISFKPKFKTTGALKTDDLFVIKKLPSGSTGFEEDINLNKIINQHSTTGSKSGSQYYKQLYGTELTTGARSVGGGFGTAAISKSESIAGQSLFPKQSIMLSARMSESESLASKNALSSKSLFPKMTTKITKQDSQMMSIPQSQLRISNRLIPPMVNNTGAQETIVKTRTRSRNGLIGEQDFFNSNALRQRDLVISGLKSQQLQKQGLKQRSRFGQYSGFASGMGEFIGPNFTPKGFGFALPKLPFMDYERKGRARKGKAFLGRYVPTVSATALNIRAPKISLGYQRGMGALIQRPIISKNKRKRKNIFEGIDNNIFGKSRRSKRKKVYKRR
jgi:hypothetical protein